MIKSCRELVGDIIEGGCAYQINALDRDELKVFLLAHLRQNHEDQLDKVTGENSDALENTLTTVM